MSNAYHDTRLALDPKRAKVWRALWRFWFSKRISLADTVLDMGSGYGDFINTVRARRCIATDQWAGLHDHASPGVEVIIGSVEELSGIELGSVDYAFASNLFEHLEQEQFSKVLSRLRPLLSQRGTLTILQPNYRFAYREYFDDYTHIAVYSHISLVDFLQANGWEVLEVHPRFLPLTVKSRLPTSDMLIGAYLKSPIKPMGKQMLVVARPSSVA
ncbi:class I SAM-dependent methyltransferase (plasmid) [Polymorphobacter sp. PAMC 29334]|uniref:class I SAM-dependent methyltransferase n=1 Tax=Polymorphobacter sp. PAMC 29334 TaxID=2862331 RepID=UPI001C6832B2|nr:class I SAM-dependent methyltransferase [Polymorphobacter sp. PAMC 29334]QYE33205.1 class I SAM-dependent methyltransferase [Polymorphobacter sp. PAMC 29334]